MLLRGMHDSGCDEIFIIVADLTRQEMDDATDYFKLVFRHSVRRSCKPSTERRIQYECALHAARLTLYSPITTDIIHRHAIEPHAHPTSKEPLFSPD